MKKLHDKRQPHRHAHGPLVAQQEGNKTTKARVRRWAKRVRKREQTDDG